MDLLKPNYNILPRAGSSLGSKRNFKPEFIAKLIARAKLNSAKATAAVSKPVELTDILTSTITIFPSIAAAEKSINASQGSLHKTLQSKGGLYKKRYTIRLLPSTEESE